MADAFLTLARASVAELPKTKGSRFIGEAFPVRSEAEAETRLAEVRAREQGATHHCWAWRLGAEGETARSSDDGEPSGTAGAPILRQIEGRDLSETLVVVTRYYGGTRLGTGGLVRAYGAAAALALDAAPIVERVQRTPLRLRFAYDDTAAAMQTLHRFDAEVAEQHYAADTTLVILVRRSQAEPFTAAFTEALAGRVEVAWEEEGKERGERG